MPGPMDPVHDYPGYEPGHKRRPPWLGIALAVAVVIIVVLSAVVITQLKDDTSDTWQCSAGTHECQSVDDL